MERPRKVVEETLDKLRSLCLSWPEVIERLSHGEPTWLYKGKKSFVTFADHHHNERVAFLCAAPVGAQSAMVEGDPTRYFVPPYVGGRGWLGVYLDVDVDWEQIREIVGEAYRVVAVQKAVR